jgi:putative pyruvate formate lyase activating enzyme
MLLLRRTRSLRFVFFHTALFSVMGSYYIWSLLLAVGLEPTRTEVHQILSLARLPVSSRQLAQKSTVMYDKNSLLFTHCQGEKTRFLLPALLMKHMNNRNNVLQLYHSCRLCPRKCQVDRRKGEKGFCGETDVIRVACACLHFGEEPVLSGKGGSGTVFFSGCTIKCEFCQNHQISTTGIGSGVSVEELAEIFTALKERGAENINLVTGTHFIPGIIFAMIQVKKNGLAIPFLWNSSGYEEKESLKLLAPYIDIWVPDLKTLQPDLSTTLSGRQDYPDKAKDALLFMQEQGKIKIEEGIMISGMIVRHLVLPGALSSTKQVLTWFKQNLSSHTLLSLMFQYIPLVGRKGCPDKGDLCRYVSKEEYEEVLTYLDELGIEDGFIQEPVNEDAWVPDFTKENPFPPEFAIPVWHYSKGFIQ